MLKDKNSSAILAVSDLARARDYYENKLGLAATGEGDEQGVLVLKTGATSLTVYESQYAGTNKANAVVWAAGEDLDEIVSALKGKGVTFERYDLPGMTHDGPVHGAGDFRAVWLKDPDGNILHIHNG